VYCSLILTGKDASLLMFFLFILFSRNEADMDLLFRWCLKDERCSDAYHIPDALQETDFASSDDALLERTGEIFGYMAERWVDDLRPPASPSGLRDLRHVVKRRFALDDDDNAEISEDAVRKHWLLLLRVGALENAQEHCAANQRFIFSAETEEGYRDCLPNRNCDESGKWRSWINVAMLSTTAVTVLIFFYLFISIYYFTQKIHFWHEYKAGLRSAEETRDALLKNK